MRIATRNCSSKNEMISNSHDVNFSYDELDAAVLFSEKYIAALNQWLINKNNKNIIDFYKQFINKNAVQQPSLDIDNDLFEYVTNDMAFTSLDIPVVMGCNLSCAYCLAAAPYVSKPIFADVEQIHKTLELVKSFCVALNKEPKEINFFGGEPTLHPRLAEIIVNARKLFPYTQLCVITNGTLLSKINNALKMAIRITKCNLIISIYGPGIYFVDTPYTIKKSSPIDCRLCYGNPNTVVVTRTINGDIVFKSSAILHPNGDFLFCSKMHAAYTIAKCGGFNCLIDGADYINLYNIFDYNEIKHFVEQATCPFSRHCRASDNVQWNTSSRQLKEWFC